MSRGILAKSRNIQFHEHLFRISPFVKFRRTDRKKKEERKYNLLIPHSRTHPNSLTVDVNCCRLLLAH